MPTDDARVTGELAVGELMERLMTADEVAAALGVHRKFVYARHHSGELRGYKLGPQYRFRPADVRAFLEGELGARGCAVGAARREPDGRAGGDVPGVAGRAADVSVWRVRRGVYQVRWREAGRDSSAHSVMVYAVTDEDARRKADTIDAEIRNRKATGERVLSVAPDRPEPVTLSEFLPVWHDAYGKDLARRTQETYAVVWDKWIAPRLGGRLLGELSPRELVSSRVEIEAAGAGGQTVTKVFTVLGSVLSEAVRQGHIAASPTRVVRRPKQHRRRAVRPPTPARVEIIRAGLGSDVDRALVTLLAYVGLRPQEALAAVWSDVTNGRLVVDAAKTGRARVVPLLPVVRQELAELQLRQGRPGPAAPIIATTRAEPWGESRFRSFRRHRWSKVAPGMRPYDLRHAYVSLMIQAGHTVVEVAKWAGHSPQVCLGTYAHLFDTVGERIDPDGAIRAARQGSETDEQRATG